MDPQNDRVIKTSGSAASGLPSVSGAQNNARSCITCRKRKVKCDKKHPCSNCAKAHIECVFPAPGRAPRKARKPPDSELLERLRRLEGVVQLLGNQIEDESQNKEVVRDRSTLPEAQGETSKHHDAKHEKRKQQKKCPAHSTEQEAMETVESGGLESRFGRLVVDEGRSRYINSSFWANLSNEVEDIRGILEGPSDDDIDSPSPSASHMNSNRQGFIFGFSSHFVDMITLHPVPEQIPAYWEMFKENADPIVKVLHVPTAENVILESKSHLDDVPKGLEVLLFSIYYCVVTSLSAEECRQDLGEEKAPLLARYRFAVEQALARANFLASEELVVLQGFVIFLFCLRRNDAARTIWALTGLVVRLAQTMGLHRDGTHFGLPPFETEMRRRLWWQIAVLDARASEDHGCDPAITEHSFDTKKPLNVNDHDIDPSMTELPQERVGCTEMTFGLIRFEVLTTFRRLMYVPPAPRRCNYFFATASLEKKEKWIAECHQRLEERYLQHCDMAMPLDWVVATVARLIMAKLWLMMYHPLQRMNGGADLSREVREKLFITSLESIEYSLLLERQQRTAKWGWLFRTYVQWHALAFLLSELCVRIRGEIVDRAWEAVDEEVATHLSREDPVENGKDDQLWKPLKKLMNKAREARARALAEDELLTSELRDKVNVPKEAHPELNDVWQQDPRYLGYRLDGQDEDEFWAPAEADIDTGTYTFGDDVQDWHELEGMLRDPSNYDPVGAGASGSYDPPFAGMHGWW